jgi:hypothetical protein
MRIGLVVIQGTAVLALAAAVAFGQAGASPTRTPPFSISSSAVSGGEVVREIDDPRNGDRWLLMRDPKHPGGPGLLRLVSAARFTTSQAGPSLAGQAPIIRAGDRVLVEEKTAVAEARLEAVALGPAWQGSSFNVRLTIGGKVLRVLAAAAGRAALEKEVER